MCSLGRHLRMGTREEGLVLTGIQAQGVRKLVNSVRIRRPANPPLQVGDTTAAEPSAFGESLLGKPREEPEVP
jgi:hypothetical protein